MNSHIISNLRQTLVSDGYQDRPKLNGLKKYWDGMLEKPQETVRAKNLNLGSLVSR